MNTKDIFGFLTIGAFAVAGGYTLYKYYNNKTSFVQAGAEIAKDGIDALDCFAKIYSDDKQEKDFFENVSESGKGLIDFIADIAEGSEGGNNG